MDSNWPGLIFHHIILDYFYTPNFWHALHFSERMYTIILPLLASKGAIPIGGEVWLPHIPCIQERLERLKVDELGYSIWLYSAGEEHEGQDYV